MRESPLRSFLARWGNMSALVLMILVFGMIAPQFLTQNNAFNVLEQTTRNGILAVGMTCVILTGGIDLSIGSVLALSGMIAGLAMQKWAPVPVGLAIAVAVGAGCGLVNGLLTAHGRLPPFIATLGMMSAARGAALMASGGQPITGFSPSLLALWSSSGERPLLPIGIMLATYLVFWWVLERTALGLHIYALGGNAQAAWLAGVDTRRTMVVVYVISGALSGLTSILLTARLNTAAPTAGSLAELEAIAAVVIGGTSLTGGEGRIAGTLVGALIMGVLRNGLNLLDVSTYAQAIIIGVTIILAVYVDRFTHRR